jgi:dephospho-CoA kinase
MSVFGLTGGIGCGKSAAAQAFTALGVPVIDADQAARDVVVPGSPALTTITEHFGTQILLDDGNLNRAALRTIIFSDAAAKTWLEQLLHPAIRTLILTRLQQPSQAPYRILESPLLLETDQHQLVKAIILVDVSPEIQLQRAMQRDNASQQQIEAIIQSQLTRQEKLARADYVLDNEGSIDALYSQVNRLHSKLCER